MTTDDHSPRPADRTADVDVYASDFVDGVIGWSDIPQPLHELVAVRAARFSAMRASLLETASHMTVDASQREAAISTALDRSVSARSRHHTASRSSRSVLALAASILAIAAISITVVQRTGSSDDALVSEASDSSTMEFGMNAMSEDVSDRSTASDLQVPSPEAMSVDEAIKDIPEYATVDDIARAVEDFFDAGDPPAIAGDAPPASGSTGSVIEKDSACIDESAEAVQVDVALLSGRSVQIRVFADGSFSVVDHVTCALIASRATSNR